MHRAIFGRIIREKSTINFFLRWPQAEPPHKSQEEAQSLDIVGQESVMTLKYHGLKPQINKF